MISIGVLCGSSFKLQGTDILLKNTHPVLRMKELLQQLAAYNYWANHKLLELINSLPEEQQVKELPSSFKSIHHTLLHMLDAESIWWQRMKLQESTIAPSASFHGTTRELGQLLLQQNKVWETWVLAATPAALEHVFMYYNSKREHFKQPVFQMITHVFNHGTYHRGQLVNMLRQLGVSKIPQTDFGYWGIESSRGSRGSIGSRGLINS